MKGQMSHRAIGTKSRGDTSSTNQPNHASLAHMPFPSFSEGQLIEKRERKRDEKERERERNL